MSDDLAAERDMYRAGYHAEKALGALERKHHGEALSRIYKLERLVQCLLDNDPDDMAADGVTVLMVWRKDARGTLGK